MSVSETAEAAHSLLYGADSSPDQVPTGAHHASKMHELIASAAGFEAMKAYENMAQRSGQPVDHATMKEVLAGLSASAVDYLIETKGLDYIDRIKAKKEAQKVAENIADEKHGTEGTDGYDDPNQ